MSDSVWPHRWQPTRLPHPWDFPGKNTWVGSHFPLQCMKVKSESEVAQSSCPTLSDPMDCSLPSSRHPWECPGKSTGVGCHCLLLLLCLGTFICWRWRLRILVVFLFGDFLVQVSWLAKLTKSGMDIVSHSILVLSTKRERFWLINIQLEATPVDLTSQGRPDCL